MDNPTRLQYLEAMGIDVWMSRASAPVATNPTFELTSTSDYAVQPEILSTPSSAWTELEFEVATCAKCGLCQTRTHTVFGTGSKTAEWMVIGEAPGQHEDEQGKPFVGKAGQLLTEMLRAVGLERDAVFITNILKCRPPGNRDPKPDEAESCDGYLRRQRELIKPKIILAVGRISAQTLLKTDAPIGKLRGKVHNMDGTPLVVVYHPAYLLRSLLEKRKAWQDLQLALRTVNNIKG
ncbi:phage SPO1 DNA polymerase-like protein [Methyloglobulus morosus KoM1]|uniref:Type-4 uracil-DNA glycosylase n=1 Tax=Methyloglobulus morosus KoM1 TaxID=1116472 RepID=V5C5W9_9GAMM|nr:uracil-DNA glycosylase [Methyloglobulus morosus]ESS73852.1 phage SPO1 DNA polymerase-like protein [Methyloglobulus morosus KoM1]